MVPSAQTPPLLVFEQCGSIGGRCFLAGVELNYTAPAALQAPAGLSRQTTSGQAVVAGNVM